MARGLFAEIQHQRKLAERQRIREQNAAVKQHNAAVRAYEKAIEAERRAAARTERATGAAVKKLEKEAKVAHQEAMKAQAEERNAALAEMYDEIDSLLSATLAVDDYVDLESLRPRSVHPPFDRPDLSTPVAPPTPIVDPPEPVLREPEPVTGIFGKAKKQAEAVRVTKKQLEYDLAEWRQKLDQNEVARRAQAEAHLKEEETRLGELDEAAQAYQAECEERESGWAEMNAQLDALISNLGYGTPEAIHQYLSIVLANSIYPDHFEATYEFDFQPETAELAMRVLVPAPEGLSTVKAYKYTKASDEITTNPLSQKAVKDRYANAVNQVALRTFHEVFESDRRGLVKTVSLEVGAEAQDPATGVTAFIPFVASAAEREAFLAFDLTGVVPAATLEHLGASVSKNPYGLVPAQKSGVRKA